MIEPREIAFTEDAVLALTELIGIMTDQLLEGNMHGRWNAERLIDLQVRLNDTFEGLSGGYAFAGGVGQDSAIFDVGKSLSIDNSGQSCFVISMLDVRLSLFCAFTLCGESILELLLD